MVDISSLSFSDALGKKVLIMGDVGAGKTVLTRHVLLEAIEKEYGDNITVIDMAPRATTVKGLSVGGLLMTPEDSGVRYLEAEDIRTPRLSAKDGEELMELADYNRKEIEKLLDKFDASPTAVLFINDVSIYLQRGDIDRLWSAIEKAETVVANGYSGEKLKEDFGTGFSNREKRMMERLASRMDIAIRL